MDKQTYLDLLSLDIQKNVLEPYKQQMQNDIKYIDDLLDNMMIYATKTIIDELEKIFEKYNVDIEFYKNEYGMMQYKYTDIPIITLDLINELLRLRTQTTISFLGIQEISSTTETQNGILKKYNIPLRLIVIIRTFDKPPLVEIVQISRIRDEIKVK